MSGAKGQQSIKAQLKAVADAVKQQKFDDAVVAKFIGS